MRFVHNCDTADNYFDCGHYPFSVDVRLFLATFVETRKLLRIQQLLRKIAANEKETDRENGPPWQW